MNNNEHVVGAAIWKKIDPILARKHLTANQLSHLAGYQDNGQIYALKNGKLKSPGFLMICRIADALGVSTDELRPDSGGSNANG